MIKLVMIAALLLTGSAAEAMQFKRLLDRVKPSDVIEAVVKQPDSVPELFYSTRWGADENACRAPTDHAPGLIVFSPTGVIIEGRAATMFKARAKGSNFMTAPFMFSDQPGLYRDLRFAVRGKQTLDYGEYVGRKLEPRGTYRRCSDHPDEPPPSPPELMQAATWGSSAAACRGELPDGQGLVVFGPDGVTVEGARADMGRAIAQGKTFLRAPFHFADETGFVTTRDLRFAVIGSQRLDYGEYRDNKLTHIRSYSRCAP